MITCADLLLAACVRSSSPASGAGPSGRRPRRSRGILRARRASSAALRRSRSTLVRRQPAAGRRGVGGRHRDRRFGARGLRRCVEPRRWWLVAPAVLGAARPPSALGERPRERGRQRTAERTAIRVASGASRGYATSAAVLWRGGAQPRRYEPEVAQHERGDVADRPLGGLGLRERDAAEHERAERVARRAASRGCHRRHAPGDPSRGTRSRGRPTAAPHQRSGR